MLDLSTEQTFKPLLNSRRPEILSWLFFVVVVGVMIYFPSSGIGRVGGYLLAAFFLLSAGAMSLANWQNRKTTLSLSKKGIRFENGIQKVWMPWETINRIEVYSGRVNDKIRVKSSDQYFAFDMYNEVVLNGQRRGEVGFEQGELILKTILQQANIDVTQKRHADGYDYYSRK
ncbi:MAG: hypothetical protein P8046_09680 [Anaerolineales bacterium]